MENKEVMHSVKNKIT